MCDNGVLTFSVNFKFFKINNTLGTHHIPWGRVDVTQQIYSVVVTYKLVVAVVLVCLQLLYLAYRLPREVMSPWLQYDIQNIDISGQPAVANRCSTNKQHVPSRPFLSNLIRHYKIFNS